MLLSTSILGGGKTSSGNKEELYVHIEDEVWINCGACSGETILAFFSNEYSCKKIYACEGDQSSLTKSVLERHISKLPSCMRDKIKIVPEYISDNTNWETYLEDDRITFINADIEGAELELLHSCKDIIIRDRPVIAVCVYHRPSDIFDLIEYIQSIQNGYIFKFRKYACYAACCRLENELVLYAIPEERNVKTQREY